MMVSFRLLAPFLLAPLAACATARLEPECAGNAMCAARAAESRILVPSRTERRGDDLLLFPSQGARLAFTDNNRACEADEVADCVGYALMADRPKIRAWVLQRFFYEGGDFLLIDDHSGKQTELDGEPIFSPDGGSFLVAQNDEENAAPYNLEIWRRDGDGAVREWAHTSDEILPDMYDVKVLRWRSNQISLALSNNSGKRIGATLTREPLGWQLKASPE